MLTSITVRDFAIIDEVAVELDRGMTVLTGETGAGKSILVDAIGLVLGDRADVSAVRRGAERAEVTATLDLADMPRVAAWLEEQALEAGDECVLRRVVGREGRSRAWINGAAVALQTLRELGERVVDIHGQHEHQSLLRAPVQRELLDRRLDDATLVARVEAAWRDWKSLAEERARLEQAIEQRGQRLDLLRYQVRELEGFAPQPGEAADLEAEHERLANYSRLAEGTAAALAMVWEGEAGSAQEAVARAAALLGGLAGVEPRLENARRLLAEAEIQLSEAALELGRYVDGLEMDPERLDAVNARLAGFRDLARKHQVEADALPGRLESLRGELDELEQAESRLDRSAASLRAAEDTWRQVAGALGSARSKAAGELSAEVTGLMHQLGMPGGRFEARVETDAAAKPAPTGADRVEFLVSANPGEPVGPIARIASGGELARISLALQVAAKAANPVPVMIFDEVDAGVGGGVAEIVGRRLRELGEHAQVLCVTHLPQVASQAHHHLRVDKRSEGEDTRTTLATLGEREKVEEVARMLGGLEITRATRAHAQEMRRKAREA